MTQIISRHLNKRSRSALRVVLALLFATALALVAAPSQQLPRALADTSTINFETYTVGTVNGQDGWNSTGAAGSGCAIYDHAIAANTYGYSAFGTQSLRISNAVTSGCFSDHTFSKSLVDEAGETSATSNGLSGGTRQPIFEAQWDFASTVPGAEQPALAVAASPDRGDGARMSWVQMTDTPTGLAVNFYDYQQSAADFVLTNVVSGLDRTTVHTLKIKIIFVDGVANDVVQIFVDGVLKHTGTSWEDYFRDVEGNPTHTVDSILFRTGGTAAPATAGKGFLIDNLTLSSGVVTLCTTDCYVDAATGNDAFGGASAAEAKKTIQAAVNQVNVGGTVHVAAGSYPEALSITKNGVTLQGAGAGTDAAQHTIIAGPVGGSSGISLPNSGTTGVTIRNLRVQGFTNGGICSTGTGNNNFTIDGVQVANNADVTCRGGIFIAGPVDGVTINNVLADSNTSRGIVIWDGFKQHIAITNNIVTNNNCCGIELQDGTASGVTITGNTVTGNADSGIAAIGLTSGAGPNLIANNTLTNNGRFGIEVKLPNGSGAESGDGSIVVRDNIVQRTTAIEVQRPTEVRDLGGIVVIRRGFVVGYNNVDIPAGVVVKNNTVSGYQQTNVGSISEGFGIVVEGRKMSISGNTVTNNDVGIQRQAGHLPYAVNTNIDGDQSNVADLYFGRGNAPVTCAVIGVNSLSGNTIATRDVTPACDTVGSLVFSTQPGGAQAKVTLSPQPVVTVLAADGNPLISYTGLVTISLGDNPGGGTLSGATSVNAVGGVATFVGLSINKPGVGYSLIAASGNLPPATSNPFTIISGPATQLAFSAQPGGALAKGALTPQPVVTVQDADGNTATAYTGQVTLAIGANPSGGTLSGTTTANAVNGVAIFANLSIDKPGAGYTLVASAAGLSSSTSTAFAITAPPQFVLYLPAIRK